MTVRGDAADFRAGAKLITGKVYWNKKDARKRAPIIEFFQLPPAVLAAIPAVEQVMISGAPLFSAENA